MATYENVYFHDDYAEQYAAMRARYHDRTKRALEGRPIDHNPTPNVAEVVFLHDDGNGGTEMTTGNFVEFFNSRYGGTDRIGAMRRSIRNAERKVKQLEREGRREAPVAPREFSAHVRSARRGSLFAHVAFAAMLIFSLTVFACSSLVLSRAESEVSALSREVAELTAVCTESGIGGTADLAAAPDASAYTLTGGDEVEIYPTDEGGVRMSVLLDALSFLGSK